MQYVPPYTNEDANGVVQLGEI